MTVLISAADNLFALNQLQRREAGFTTSADRLSSGAGVQRPADDIAAFSVGSRLALQARGWNTGLQNVQNGISLLQTADGATGVIQDALNRMRELAVQSANGAWTADQRASMQDEAKSLLQTIFDTVDGTMFDNIPVLRGQSIPAQNSVDVSNVASAIRGAVGLNTQSSPPAGYPVVITQQAQRGQALGTNNASVVPPGPPVTLDVTGPLGSASFVFNPGDTPATMVAAINAVTATTGVNAQLTDNTTLLDDGTPADPNGDGFLLLNTTTPGSTSSISVHAAGGFVDVTGFANSPTLAHGKDMQGTINGTSFVAAGLTITAPANAGGAANLSITFGSFPPVGTAGNAHVFVGTEQFVDLGLEIQYAPNTGDEHLVDIPSFRVGYLDPTTAGTIKDVDLTTQASAQSAIDVLDAASAQVNASRAQIGAHLSALQGELALAGYGQESQQVATSQIMDADVAREAANLASSQVLSQAGLSAISALRNESIGMANLVQSMLGGPSGSASPASPLGLPNSATA